MEIIKRNTKIDIDTQTEQCVKSINHSLCMLCILQKLIAITGLCIYSPHLKGQIDSAFIKLMLSLTSWHHQYYRVSQTLQML